MQNPFEEFMQRQARPVNEFDSFIQSEAMPKKAKPAQPKPVQRVQTRGPVKPQGPAPTFNVNPLQSMLGVPEQEQVRPNVPGSVKPAADLRQTDPNAVRDLDRVEQYKKAYEGRSGLGQLGERLFTKYASGDQYQSPEAKRDLELRRQALGIESPMPEANSVSDWANRLRGQIGSGIASAPGAVGGILDMIANSPTAGMTGYSAPVYNAETEAKERAVRPQQKPVHTFTNALSPVSDLARRGLRSASPVNPETTSTGVEGFLRTTAPQAIGSGLDFLAGGTLAKGIGIPQKAATAFLGASGEIGSFQEEAAQMGIDPRRIDRGVALAGIAGLTEIFGVGDMLDRFGAGKLKHGVINKLLEVLEEGGQESVQGVLEDINAALNAAYDPQRQSWDPRKLEFYKKRLEEFAGGAIGAGPMIGATSALEAYADHRQAPAIRAIQAEQPAPLNLTASRPGGKPTTVIPLNPNAQQAAQLEGAKEAIGRSAKRDEANARAAEILAMPEGREKQKALKDAESDDDLDTALFEAMRTKAQSVADNILLTPAQKAQRLAQSRDLLGTKTPTVPRSATPLQDALARRPGGDGFIEGAAEVQLTPEQQTAEVLNRQLAHRDAAVEQTKARLQTQREQQTEQSIAQAEALNRQLAQETETEAAQRQADDLYNQQRQSAVEIGQRADQLASNAQYSEALVEMARQKAVLVETARNLPRTPASVEKKADIQAEIARIKQNENYLKQVQRNPRTRTANDYVPTPLLNSIVNPEGGIIPNAQLPRGGTIGGGIFSKLTENAPPTQYAGEVPDILTTIRRLGGVRDDGVMGGEIRSILSNKETGTTGLINKNGLLPDEMRAALVDEGLIDPDSTVNDLLTMLDNAARSRERKSGHGTSDEDLNAWYEQKAREEAAPVNEFDEFVQGENQIPASISPAQSNAEATQASEDRRPPMGLGSERTNVAQGVSLSPYADLKANNKELINQLYDLPESEDRGDRFDEGVAKLREWADAHGIEQRHVNALAADIQNYHSNLAKTDFLSDAEYLDWATEQADKMLADAQAESSDTSEVDFEREVEALRAFHADENGIELFNRARFGGDAEMQEMADYAENEFGLNREAIIEAVEEYKKLDEAAAGKFTSPRSPLQTRVDSTSQATAIAEIGQLLRQGVESLTAENVDPYLETLEAYRNRAITAGDIPDDLYRALWEKIADTNKQRSAFVRNKELPAKFENKTLNKAQTEEKIRRERDLRERRKQANAETNQIIADVQERMGVRSKPSELSRAQSAVLEDLKTAKRPTTESWLINRLKATPEEIKDLTNRGLIRKVDGGYLAAEAPLRRSEQTLNQNDDVVTKTPPQPKPAEKPAPVAETPFESPLKSIGKLGVIGQSTHTKPSELTKELNAEVRLVKAQEPAESDARAARAIPTFQGGKTKMARAATGYIRRFFGRDAAKITEIDDWFAGSGSWGAYMATTVFPNVKTIRVHEFNPQRAAKVRLFHERGDQIASLVRHPVIARVLSNVEKILDNKKTYSGSALARAVQDEAAKLQQIKQSDTIIDGVLQAIVDHGSASFGVQEASSGRAAIDRTLAQVSANAKEAHAQIAKLRARGVKFEYVVGDSYADAAVSGSHVLSIVDPPYYGTKGYNGVDMVSVGTYEQTRDLLARAKAAQNSVIYTDEAWWEKHEKDNGKTTLPTDAPENLFGQSGRGMLTSIRSEMDDFFRIPIAERIETVGLYNGTRTRAVRQPDTSTRSTEAGSSQEVNQPGTRPDGGKADRGMAGEGARSREGVSADGEVRAEDVKGPRSLKMRAPQPPKYRPVNFDKKKAFTAYRGASDQNRSQSTNWPGVVFLSKDKKSAAQWGDVSEHNISATVLNWSPENETARRILFALQDGESLKDIKSPNDLRDRQKFDDYGGVDAFMFPDEFIAQVVTSFGYDGLSFGDDFWLAGDVSRYERPVPKESLKMRAPTAPTFYSALERFVSDKKFPNKASGAQMLAMIQKPQSGVKPDEVKWLGLEDWLRSKDSVTKDEVLDFIRANNVKVEEVVKGGPLSGKSGEPNVTDAAIADEVRLLQQHNIRVARDPYNDEDPANAMIGFIDERHEEIYDIADFLAAARNGKYPPIVASAAERVEEYLRSDTGKLYEASEDGLAEFISDASENETLWNRLGADKAFSDFDSAEARADYLSFDAPETADDYVRSGQGPAANLYGIIGPFQVMRPKSGGNGYAVYDSSGNDYGFADTPVEAIKDAIGTAAYLNSDDAGNLQTDNPTKYSQYTLKGAKDRSYRELLLTMPGRHSDDFMSFDEWAKINNVESEDLEKAWIRSVYEGEKRRSGEQASMPYRSGHWDEDNILAHIRFNERTDADGKRVLFVEEIQSDWAQGGRKRGYRKVWTKAEVDKFTVDEDKNAQVFRVERNGDKWDVIGPMGLAAKFDSEERANEAAENMSIGYNRTAQGDYIVRDGDGRVLATPPKHLNKSAQEALRLIQKQALTGRLDTDRVAPMPFPKTDSWAMLAFKRVLRHAAENGYDRIAWTTGDIQAERYDLSKQVKEIEYVKRGDQYELGVTAINGDSVKLPKDRFTADELEDVVGKEIAQKIVNGEGRKYRGHDGYTLEGLDLKVGGEGMKGFYDAILPSAVNKYLKKWGVKAGETKVDADGADTTVHSVDITDAMRESVLQGQPLFMRGEQASPEPSNRKSNTPEFMRSPALPTGDVGIEGSRAINEAAAGEFRQRGNGQGTVFINNQASIVLDRVEQEAKGQVGKVLPFGGEVTPLSRAEEIENLLRDKAEIHRNAGREKTADALEGLADLIKEARQDAKANNANSIEIINAQADFSKGMSDIYGSYLDSQKKARRHEALHSWQFGVNKDKPGLLLNSEIANDPDFETVRDHLADYYENLTSDDLWAEAVAFIGSGDWNRVGLNKEQAVDFLDRFFTMVAKKYGRSALRGLRFAHPTTREVLENVGRRVSETGSRSNESITAAPEKGNGRSLAIRSDQERMAAIRSRSSEAQGSNRGRTGQDRATENYEVKKAPEKPQASKTPDANPTIAAIEAAKQIEREKKSKPSPKALRAIGEIYHASRTILASSDLSALRQGMFMSLPPSRWPKAWKATRTMFGSIRRGNYDRFVAGLESHPDYKIAQEAGLFFATEDQAKLTDREESYISEWAANLPVVKQSEQAFKSYLDSLRMDTFAMYKRALDSRRAAGVITDTQYGQALRESAYWINTSTGRGVVRGKVGDAVNTAMPVASAALFAPRYLVSRFQLINPITYARNAADPAKRVVLRNQMSEIFQSAAVLASIGYGASLLGASVNWTDPDDPDWLKLKFGNTRFDALAGVQQVARLAYRIGKWLKTEATEDDLKKLSDARGAIKNQILTFGRTKLAPVPSFFIDWMNDWKSVVGEQHKPFEFAKKEGAAAMLGEASKDPVISRYIPLLWSDMVEAYVRGYREGGATVGAKQAAKFSPAIFGIGVQDYERKSNTLSIGQTSKPVAEMLDKFGLKFAQVRPDPGEPEDVLKERVQRINVWMDAYGEALINNPRFQKLSPDLQKAALENLRGRVGGEAKRKTPKLSRFNAVSIITGTIKGAEQKQKRSAGNLYNPPE